MFASGDVVGMAVGAGEGDRVGADEGIAEGLASGPEHAERRRISVAAPAVASTLCMPSLTPGSREGSAAGGLTRRTVSFPVVLPLAQGLLRDPGS